MGRPEQGTFTVAGHRLAYTSYGEGPRVTVLVHGLLLSQRMHEPLARSLAERGQRVLTLDLLGHGRSDRPRDMWRYSMTAFGEEVVALDAVRQDPAPSAAVLQGLFFGRTAPHRNERRTFETPALVIGHGHDVVHPFSDADMLVAELPNGRLVRAGSILELRLAPERLTGEIGDFIDECWRPRPARRRRRTASS